MIGVLTFLVLMLVSVQVLYNLYATSAVTAAAYDGARLVAGFDSAHDPEAVRVAEEHVRNVLGPYGRDRLRLVWEEDPLGRDVILRVSAENPSFLPRHLRAPLGLDTVDRTIRVRIERER